MSTRVDRLLADANPVPAPAPTGRVTPAQEQLLSSLVATPRRRRSLGRVLPRLVPVAAGVAVAVLVLVLVRGGSATNDEVEATASPTATTGELLHVVTRLYGSNYGPGYGERLDGWLQPSTGRARLIVTTGTEMTLQHVVGGDDRVQSWQGALGNAGGVSDDRVAPDFAANLRASVRDRMPSLVQLAKEGFRADNTTFGAPTTQPGEYRGKAVTIHRIAPTIRGEGTPSGYYFKWYTDDTGAIVAFERGPVGKDGKDLVDEGEELMTFEAFGADEAPLHELAWQQPPDILQTPAPPPATTRPEPVQPGARATPTPTPATPQTTRP